jgi:hypothetical protein
MMLLFDWIKPIRTPQELVRRKHNWRDALLWVRGHIEYEREGSVFPRPVDVMKRARANCKGFASLTAEILFLFGFFPRIISYAIRKDGEDTHHVVVFFRSESSWIAVSNGLETRVKIPVEAELLDAVKWVAPSVYYAQEVDPAGSHIQTLISKL